MDVQLFCSFLMLCERTILSLWLGTSHGGNPKRKINIQVYKPVVQNTFPIKLGLPRFATTFGIFEGVSKALAPCYIRIFPCRHIYILYINK
jgi:hypothetical protein